MTTLAEELDALLVETRAACEVEQLLAFAEAQAQRPRTSTVSTSVGRSTTCRSRICDTGSRPSATASPSRRAGSTVDSGGISNAASPASSA